MSAEHPRMTMPYIGLRPFHREDADLFFGREDQVDGLLERLETHRLLAVVGTSGCGKSSLVRAGLVPDLENGFMVEAGEDWKIATLLPGGSPLRNLAAALVEAGALGVHYTAPDAADAVAAILRRGPRGLEEVLAEARLPEGTSLLVIVDQFEEIFRFRRHGDPAEAAAFVNLLLHTAASKQHPVYVVLTMRSDYLGDCAVFPGLPEALNDAQFLVPRLSRTQLETAITGPASLFDGDVDEVLLNRILNELGSQPDQLPLMQHALMRMWSLPDEDREEGASRVLDLDGYEAIGGLEHALSNHVSAVSRELTFGLPTEEREALDRIVRVLFRSLCDVTSGRDDIRRPAALSEVADVAGVESTEVIRVVEAFRTPDCSFIMPPAGVPMAADTILDIAHESLIRNWDDLREWRGEEARWKEEYDRLAQSARRWSRGKAALSVPPELDAQLAWNRTETVGPAWAARYGPVEDFELAQEYLEESGRADRARKEQRRRTRSIVRLSVLGAAVVLVVALTIALQSYLTAAREADAAHIAHHEARTALEEQKSTMQELEKSEASLKDKTQALIKNKEELLAKTNAALASEASLQAKSTKLLLTQADLENTNAKLKREYDQSRKARTLAEKAKDEALAARTLADGRMLNAAAMLACVGQDQDLVKAMLLALRARSVLGTNEPGGGQVLHYGVESLLPFRLVRPAGTDPVYFFGDLEDGGLLLATDSGVLELLDPESGTLQRIAMTTGAEQPAAVLPGPGPGMAVVVTMRGNAIRVRGRDGQVLPLSPMLHRGAGRNHEPGRLLVWGDIRGEETMAWEIVAGMDQSAIAQGTLPCAPAGSDAAALDTDGTGFVVICDDGNILTVGEDASAKQLDRVDGTVAWASTAPGGEAAVILTLDKRLEIRAFPGTTLRQIPGVLQYAVDWRTDHLVTVDEHERMAIWSLSTGEPGGACQVPGYDRRVTPVVRGDLTAWADVRGNVHVWDWNNDRKVGQAPLRSYPITMVLTGTAAKGGLWIADSEGTLRGWRLADRPSTRVIPPDVAESYEDSAASTANGPVSLQELIAEKPVAIQSILKGMDIDQFYVSPDGSTILGHERSGRTSLVSGESGDVVELGIPNSLYAAAFSPDGHRVATTGGDRSIRIWDLDGEEVAFLPLKSPARWLGFPRDNGPLLYRAGPLLQEWDWIPMASSELVSAVCERLPRRNLFAAEWKRYLGPDAYKISLCPDRVELHPGGTLHIERPKQDPRKERARRAAKIKSAPQDEAAAEAASRAARLEQLRRLEPTL